MVNETKSARVFQIKQITKIFDRADGFTPLIDPRNVTDATVVHRDGRWWMYLAGTVLGSHGTHLFSASLPPGAPLASSGWTLTPREHEPTKIAVLGRS
jgi:hypothetical protein